MATLQEILNNDWNNESVKTAAAQGTEATANEASAPVSSDEEILKIATELGIYADLFPEDTAISSVSEKTAEEIKVAQYQEAVGARSFDYFSQRSDSRMSKIASDILKVAGEEMSSADMVAAQGNLPGARPVNAVPTNQDIAGDKAPRTPPSPAGATPYSVVAGQEAGAEGASGHYEQKMAAAISKHFLLSQLAGK